MIQDNKATNHIRARARARTRTRVRLGLISLVSACVAGNEGDSREPTASGPAVWRLSDQPTISIGVVEGDERYQLVNVNSAWKHSDGRIGAYDSGKHALLFFDSTGKYLSQSGAKGRGPGEFQIVAGAWRYRGDSIAVYDLVLRRLSVFDANGRFARSFNNPVQYIRRPGIIPSQSCCVIWLSFADGSFVGRPPDDIPNQPGPPRYGTVTFMRVSPDGVKQDTIGTFQSSLYKHDPTRPNGIRGYRASFGFRYTVVGDDLVGGEGPEHELIAVMPGNRTHGPTSISLPGEARPFTAELQAEYREALRVDYELRGRTAYEGTLESALAGEFAPLAPRFGGIRSDADNQIWLERWGPLYSRLGAPLDYDVITRTGRHVASMKLPTGSRFMWAGRGEILLLERDSLDVQYLRLYKIAPSTERT